VRWRRADRQYAKQTVHALSGVHILCAARNGAPGTAPEIAHRAPRGPRGPKPRTAHAHAACAPVGADFPHAKQTVHALSGVHWVCAVK
jgi:hypothetical protein